MHTHLHFYNYNYTFDKKEIASATLYKLRVLKEPCSRDPVQLYSIKAKIIYFPSEHMKFIQRRINVDATSWRCIDVITTLYKRHMPAWLQ